jgi:hypothetical protein
MNDNRNHEIEINVPNYLFKFNFDDKLEGIFSAFSEAVSSIVCCLIIGFACLLLLLFEPLTVLFFGIKL